MSSKLQVPDHVKAEQRETITATNSRGRSCAKCDHFGSLPRDNGEPATICRRKSPTVNTHIVPMSAEDGKLMLRTQTLTAWPGVAPSDWCGEYEPGADSMQP